jgi:hypothetical protein
MVTMGSSVPRTRSVLLSGGNREGASGPGVGAALIAVQAGGVAINTLGRAGAVVTGAAGDEEQAVRKVRSTKKEVKRKEKGLRMLNMSIVLLGKLMRSII